MDYFSRFPISAAIRARCSATFAAHASFLSIKEENHRLLVRVLGKEPSGEINYIFPSFLIHYAPAGVLGILLAVIFAAAMSTFSSEINSLAGATIIDFYKRFFNAAGTLLSHVPQTTTDKHKL